MQARDLIFKIAEGDTTGRAQSFEAVAQTSVIGHSIILQVSILLLLSLPLVLELN